MLFGPAGIPLSSTEGGTVDGIRTVKKLGLGAMELEFVRGVYLSKKHSSEARKEAKNLNISLSCHAPYWINCCAKEKIKLKRTIRNLLDTARAAHASGAHIIVFHPGYYMGRPASACAKLVKATLQTTLEKMHEAKIHDVFLGPELAGKVSQFGSLDEIIALSKELPQTKPVIDFAHYHARNNGLVKGKEDYEVIFKKLEKELGSSAVKNFHAHFSEIEYTQKGERRHLELGASNEPPYLPLMQLCAEKGYSGTVICESPLLEQDALKLQKTYSLYSSRQ